MLIVCGSATSWILKKLFKNKDALHNRLTGRIYLGPFSLHECEEFFQDRGVIMTRYQMLESYMVFGGIPYYLDLFQKGLSLSQNIDRLCFGNRAPLKDEYHELYQSLFENYDRHIAIVEELSNRKSGMTRDELSTNKALPANGHLTAALEELEQCGIIIKFSDFTRPKNGAYYRLVDPFTLFYLKYMRDNHSKDEYYWTNYIEDGAKHAWVGYAFELLCLLHISEIKRTLGISGMSTNSVAWRSKNHSPGAQIDLLIDRRDGVINICEMKYSKHPYTIDKSDAEDLERKVATFASETGTEQALHITMVTTYGISQKGYASIMQSEINMDNLFGE
jgi:hypothetical protein